MQRPWHFYWLRWILGLLKFLFRRTPSRSILRHEVQRIDAASIRGAVDRSEPFALRLGGEQVNIRAAAAPVADPDARVMVDGIEHTPPPAQAAAYSGSVEGDEDSDVRLTITDSVVMGYVRTRHGWYWIEPMRRFRAQAEPGEYVIYKTSDTVFRLPFGEDGPKGGTADADDGDGKHRVNPHIGIAMWGDTSFRDQAELIGLTWTQAQAALVNQVNGIYQSELGIEFVIRVFVLHVGNSLTSKKAEDLLDQLGVRVRAVHGDIRQLAVRQSTNIEVAHLLTGRNLKGKTIGVAWQPGVWGLAEHHHVPSGIWFLEALEKSLLFQNMMVSAHELGHNFTGDHDAADEMCVTRVIWCWDYERTVMWKTFYSDNRDEFSQDNADRILNNAQNGRNTNFTHV